MTAMRYTHYLTILILALGVCCAANALAEGPYKLKPEATGKVCFDCHTAFEGKMQAEYVHTPLAMGECTGCHNPHASNHGMLLSGPQDTICFSCHEQMVPDQAVSLHPAAAAGNCVACHDPHASDNPANLVTGGSELCFTCHEGMGELIAANEFGHTPVEQDCLTCHNPHASLDNPALLSTQEPDLCLQCHSTDSDGFRQAHMNYPVEQGRCTTCHNPHGSNNGAILADTVHAPIQNEMCNQCHNEPDAAEPFAVTATGFQLCQGCHYDTVNESFAKDRLHWPMADQTGCLNCHSPHASSEQALLSAPLKQVCGDCHADTLARQDRAATKHPPVNDGECMICHSPHASDNLFLRKEATTMNSCGECHDWQTHSTHPIGEEVIDPRNPNIELDCLSCHRTHGTEYKHFIYYSDIQSLCVQCHTKYRR